MTVLAAATSSDPRALWYMTRGFGLVALLLLTITTVLGLSQAARYARPGLPRFVISALHRNASLLGLVAIAVHVATAVADSYAPIHVVDVLVPFVSKYRPLWTGLGALTLDLMLAVIITSLLRERIGHRTWRAVHWASYACWPVAVLHGLGTGSDSVVGWVQLLYILAGAAVVLALWARLTVGVTSSNSAVRVTAGVLGLVLPVAIAGWSLTGPLKAGWARRAGTPPSLLASRGATPAPAAAGSTTTGGSTSGGNGSAGAASAQSSALPVPFSAAFHGTRSTTGPDGNGLVSVRIDATFSGAATGSFSLVLTGQPVDGGVSLTGSSVQLGPTSAPGDYTGHVTSLDGNTVISSLTDGSGRRVAVTIRIDNPQETQVTGNVQVQA